VEGEATAVTIGGGVLVEREGPAKLAAGAAALAILVGLAWAFKSALLSPFYTRIDPARLLSNPNRARIRDLVRASPGLAPADLARLTGSARVVVDHHLRILVAHGHLVARRSRHRISYFAREAAPRESAHAHAEAVRDATRRRIAREILETPGLTQKEIAERLSLRLRLVSHHIRRLEAESLVIAEGAMPRRHRPLDALAEALRADA
jgi:predicted transcriptional regulator